MDTADFAISDEQQFTLVNICRFAAEKYRENARTLLELASAEEGHSSPRSGYKDLAAQFERQAEEASDFADRFENATEIAVVAGGPDMDDEMAEVVGAAFAR